ncbi:Glycine-rich protein HC1 [Capsicum baccatum]|uniref:Glycine-rich protein HC1 n=1 Tax=Capsicum baccatum TaxID=33114 RepID=A0A2G2W2C8_CAPBA|nr:Glycine-rich protein HC1 [Capsicum baccatum]
MGSKAFLFLGLLLAIFIMISSQVLARELAENAKGSENKNEVHEDHYPGDGHGGYPGGGYPGGERGGYPGGGYPGDRYPRVKPGGFRQGGYCQYGCCHCNDDGCYRCCSHEGEAMDKVTEDKPHN